MHSYQSTNYGFPQEPQPPNPPVVEKQDTRERLQKRRELEFQVQLKDADINPEDVDFLLEKRKQDIHRDQVFLDCFTFIRKYDYLPKSVLTECFTRSLKYVYDLKKERELLDHLSEEKEVNYE